MTVPGTYTELLAMREAMDATALSDKVFALFHARDILYFKSRNTDAYEAIEVKKALHVQVDEDGNYLSTGSDWLYKSGDDEAAFHAFMEQEIQIEC